MEQEERLDYLIGQVAALKAFCAAILVDHPAPSNVLAAFNKAGEMAISKTLPTVASEPMLTGMQTMCADLSTFVQLEINRQQSKNLLRGMK